MMSNSTHLIRRQSTSLEVYGYSNYVYNHSIKTYFWLGFVIKKKEQGILFKYPGVYQWNFLP